MSKVALIAKIPAAPGKRDDLAKALETMLEAVEQEDGCLRYILHEDAQDPDLLWFYELYTDQAAVDAHSSSDAMKGLGQHIGPFLGGAPVITVLRPVGGKGL
jgi:quinol monooxygenase YgiN